MVGRMLLMSHTRLVLMDNHSKETWSQYVQSRAVLMRGKMKDRIANVWSEMKKKSLVGGVKMDMSWGDIKALEALLCTSEEQHDRYKSPHSATSKSSSSLTPGFIGPPPQEKSVARKEEKEKSSPEQIRVCVQASCVYHRRLLANERKESIHPVL